MAKKLIHICEVCGKTEILTPEEAFNDGWDYPPRMGGFGIVGATNMWGLSNKSHGMVGIGIWE